MNSTEWIRVEDSLPEEGIKVLTFIQVYDEVRIDYLIYFPEPIWACILEREQNKVTHWMPLPNPPNVNKRHSLNAILAKIPTILIPNLSVGV